MAIKQALSHCGYSFLETGKALKKFRCAGCGTQNYPAGTNNNDAGTPDLLVFRDHWPAGMMLGLEVKAPKGWKWSSIEQKELADRQRIVVAHGVREALLVVQRFEIDLNGEGYPRVHDWLKANEGAKI
jgi:hypothetical protein